MWKYILFILLILSACKYENGNNELESYLQENLFLNIRNQKINVNSINLKDENGDTLRFETIPAKDKTVFFIYSEINCDVCIEKILSHLSDAFPVVFENIIIISKYDNPRDLYIFKRINGINGKIYNDVDNHIIGLFQNNLPLFFTYKNNDFKNLFWADKSYLALLDKYIIQVNSNLN